MSKVHNNSSYALENNIVLIYLLLIIFLSVLEDPCFSGKANGNLFNTNLLGSLC